MSIQLRQQEYQVGDTAVQAGNGTSNGCCSHDCFADGLMTNASLQDSV